MAQPRKSVLVVVVAVTLMLLVTIGDNHRCNAQLCNVTAAGLTACKPSVSNPNPKPPSDVCCSALEHADFKCFCKYYKNADLMKSLGIDPQLAKELPEKCNSPQAPVKCD
ncbi:hypothetical protein Scep_010765 [Stephania cephalantha]|uniref:Bifunctional inhibitor/plant lipid transfer protein/seed storage helical domain-containing protein n=1 Tax=Stephania cephalantha TaxID=152367 RepID=A0AAP0PFK2_9MAGN